MTDTADTKLSAEIEALSFEQALGQLEQVVARLETGQASLEDSIDLYTRGNLLRTHCEKRLKAAEARIEKITLDGSGTPAGTQTFDGEQA